MTPAKKNLNPLCRISLAGSNLDLGWHPSLNTHKDRNAQFRIRHSCHKISWTFNFSYTSLLSLTNNRFNKIMIVHQLIQKFSAMVHSLSHPPKFIRVEFFIEM